MLTYLSIFARVASATSENLSSESSSGKVHGPLFVKNVQAAEKVPGRVSLSNRQGVRSKKVTVPSSSSAAFARLVLSFLERFLLGTGVASTSA